MGNNTLFIIGGVSIAIVAMFLLFDYLKSKGISTGTILKNVETGLEEAEVYTKSAVGLTTGKLKEALGFAEGIEHLALTGVGFAQQLLISSQIQDDGDGSKRKAEAMKYIYSALKNQGITIDSNVETIVNGIVENTVFSSKAIGDINGQLDKLIQEKVTNLQNEKDELLVQVQQLQSEKSKLITERDSLKSAITTAATTAATVQPIAQTVTNTTEATPTQVVQ